MVHNFITNSASQTKKLGEAFAKKILKLQSPKNAVVLGLEGNLGGGKTCFLQGFAKGIGIKQRIVSPTFVIMKKFKIKSVTYALKPKTFIHIDCYRLKEPEELTVLGFKEILSDSKNIVAIEWSDNVKKFLPKDAFILKFDFINKNTRKIEVRR